MCGNICGKLLSDISLNTQEIKDNAFLIGQNRTKRAHFRGSPLFQTTYNIKTEKQTTNSLGLCQVLGSWWKEKGMRLTKWLTGQFRALFLLPASHIQLTRDKSWINCLFFCFYVVRSLKKRTSLKICTFCQIKKCSLQSLVCFGSSTINCEKFWRALAWAHGKLVQLRSTCCRFKRFCHY